MAEAAALARDLINTPSNDMGPEELAEAAQQLSKRFGASFNCIIGDDLVRQNFPLIHAVGMASTRAPRLIDMVWGDPAHPKVTLVGKGVCFDTGGLDLKPSSGMLIMKKDMGGAANVLALALMVMDAKLKVRLRVLIPAVENAVAGNAFRPLDIFPSRKGPTVEIGNTDAEGRLVLADALALADEEKPDLLIDLGTLTGAARVALGPELPPFYTDDESLAQDLAMSAKRENDPLWRLPLWPPYDSWLDSKVADTNNAPSGGFAGSIICALFLQRFVEAAKSWLHVDIYGWTPSAKPARPEGGECQAARAIYKLLSDRYA
jgi:leucyl aminopeptidase